MGYIASGSGTIYLAADDSEGYAEVAKRLKENSTDRETVIKAIFERAGDDGLACEEYSYTGTPCCIELSLSHYDRNYYEDDIQDFFDVVKPLLRTAGQPDAGIYFTGEDETYWAFHIDQDKSYEIIRGEVVYDCRKCSETSCAFEHNGRCRFHAVYDRFPDLKQGKCIEYLESNQKIKTAHCRNCLNCANSFSEGTAGGDVLHCANQHGKIVDDNECCGEYN